MEINEIDRQHFINIKTVLQECGGSVDSGAMMMRLNEIEQKKKAEALKALAEGNGYLEPNFMRDRHQHNLSIIYNDNNSYCNVFDHEAFSALKSAKLSREQINYAVRKCQSMCKTQIAEVFKMFDDNEHLDSLIKTEDFTDYLGF